MRLLLNVFKSVLILFFFVAPAFAQSDDPFALPNPVQDSKQATQKSATKPAKIAAQEPAGAELQKPIAAEKRNPTAREVTKHIQSILDKKVDFAFEDVPWNEIEEDLEITYEFNVVLTPSCRDDSLTEEEPMTVDLSGVRLRTALRIMLESKNATFVVQDGLMKIISLDDAEDVRYFTRRLINVRPLLTLISNHERARIGKPKQTKSHGLISVVPVVGKQEPIIQRKVKQRPVRPVDPAKPVAPSVSPDDLISAESLLIDLIQHTISPECWQDNGQGLATVKILGGCLVVNTTEEMAEELQDFLQDLTATLSE